MAVDRPDRLSALIRRFRISAKVGFAGNTTCATSESPVAANLVILRHGRITPGKERGGTERLVGPLLLYWPRRHARDLRIDADGAEPEFVLASVEMGGAGSPIALALPALVREPLAENSPLRPVADLLFEEALSPRCGGGAVIDRLCEVLMIRLLRHLIEAGHSEAGLLAGLAHPNLSHAIVAMHEAPQHAWHLEDLAEIAGMSRTAFAVGFRSVVGVTPGEYLSGWRLTVARTEIERKTPLKIVARKVGFSGPAALSRAFSRRYGLTPRQLAEKEPAHSPRQ